MNSKSARNSRVLVTAIAMISILGLSSYSLATQGDCGQPVSDGSGPVATDCLFILSAAVGITTCTPECICDLNGAPPVTSTDALICLNVSVGNPPPDFPNCPCDSTTTTSTTTTTTTTTTTSTTTTTTLAGTVACDSAGAPSCDGACGPDELCRTGGEGCFCQPVGCGDYMGAPLCFGLCPENEECVIDGNDCQCVPSAILCNTAEVPQCNGDCPASSFCGADEFTGQCQCFVTGCGDFQPAPLCWGTCPPGSVCEDIDSTCTCVGSR